MDELLNKVAEMRGMPASLVKRSAEARAEKEGMTLEAVLADWAGEEVSDGGAAPEAAETPATEAAEGEAPEPAEEPAADAVPGQITVDYLVKLAAEAKRMPPKLILTSAQARAPHSGVSLETVLAGWAGVDLDELKEAAANAPAAAQKPAPSPEPEAATPKESPETPAAKIAAPEQAVVAAAAGAGAMISMDELLDKVAEAKGMPAALAKRSAEARAKKTGEPLEAVLAEWAGVDPSSVSSDAAPAAAAPPAASEPAPAEPADEPEVVEEEVEVHEAITDTEPEPGVAAVGARMSRYPAWLAAAFVIIPLLAVTYILISPNGPDCGTSGQLLIDPVTGNAVNCDGSDYGTEVVDYFANGAAVYAQCQACHGSDGGGGAGPAFSGGSLLATFPAGSCSEQVEWITLGTAGWPDATYGANNKPVGGFGLMPAFGTTLDPQQIAEVALYERVQFGGQDLADAQADCGLGEDHGEGESVEASGS